MKREMPTLVKLGGSLCQREILLPLIGEIRELAREYSLLILPGGGPFTDLVRQVEGDFPLDGERAHWMAILGMEQYGHLLAHLLGGQVLTSLNQIESWSRGQGAVFLPYRQLWEENPLPCSWDVTSDTIAAWLASRVGSKRLILLKSVDGVTTPDGVLFSTAGGAQLEAGDWVDPSFFSTLEPGLETWLINGSVPGRLTRLLREGRVTGTRIVK